MRWPSDPRPRGDQYFQSRWCLNSLRSTQDVGVDIRDRRGIRLGLASRALGKSVNRWPQTRCWGSRYSAHRPYHCVGPIDRSVTGERDAQGVQYL